MWEKMMASPIVFALLASVLYGIAGPMMKWAGAVGTTVNGLAFAAGMGMLVCSINYSGTATTMFSSPKAVGVALALGLVYGIALRVVSYAITLKGGDGSVVFTIVAAYPLVTVICGVLFFGEAERLNLVKVFLGTVLIVAGVCLIGTSAKGETHAEDKLDVAGVAAVERSEPE